MTEKRKVRRNAINIATALALLLMAIWLDAATESLKRYTGATFNFRLSLWGFLGIDLLFSVFILGFFLVAYKYQPPDRWVYSGFIGFPAVVLILFVLTFMMPLEVFSNLHLPLTQIGPGSFAGMAIVVLFWAGVGGLVLPNQK